jgi:hypothetical protein
MAGAALAFALMGGGARADVFVPDDPAAHDVDCVATAGDVVVATRSDGRRRSIVELSEAGGPWRQVARIADLPACPEAAAASDGTAVIGLADRLLVRRPGGAFTPVALDMRETKVAAAPGGWAAAVGERVRESLRNDLAATIVAPDGTARSTTLERARVNRHRFETFLDPRIGIAANGAATVTWTGWEAITGDYVLRTAATADGTTWTARRLGRGADPKYNFPYLGQADVAVAPGGHTLLAWADGRGLHVSVDGGAPERLARPRTAGSPTAAIADDGSAVVAYGVASARVLASDRGPGGTWTVPHELAGDRLGPGDGSEPGTPQEVALTSVVAPGGEAVVAWVGGREGRRLVATSGRPGGPWTTASPVSLITRDAVSPSLGVAASGEPRLMWIETAERGPADRLRAARLLPDDPAADRTAPVLTTRLPARTPRTRTGRVVLTIPVGCSEACDARVRLLHRRIGYELVGVVREVPAGGTTTARLRIDRLLANDILRAPSERTPRLEVTVSDRAGNVARQSRLVRFRLAARSLLSFRVGLNHNFLMYSRAGDRAVVRFVNGLITALAGGEIDSFKELRRRYRRGLRAIERRHDEVTETDPLDEIFTVLEVPLARKGYSVETVMAS